MKKFYLIGLLAVLICFCSCNSDFKKGYHTGALSNIKEINDYESLKSIGVGVVSSGSRAPSTNSIITNKPTGTFKLVGIDKDGVCKILSFLDEDGTMVSQDNYCLLNFRDFYSYVFFQFAPPEYLQYLGASEFEECGNFLESNHTLYEHDLLNMQYKWSAINGYLTSHPEMKNEFVVYVLDKKTGKIYELIDTDGDLAVPCFYLMYQWEDPYPRYYCTKNYAGFVSATVTLDDNRNQIITNYRMSVAGETLVLEKLHHRICNRIGIFIEVIIEVTVVFF